MARAPTEKTGRIDGRDLKAKITAGVGNAPTARVKGQILGPPSAIIMRESAEKTPNINDVNFCATNK